MDDYIIKKGVQIIELNLERNFKPSFKPNLVLNLKTTFDKTNFVSIANISVNHIILWF